MKTNELRIGNYVKYTDGRMYAVDAIDAPMKRTNLKGLKFWNTVNDISPVLLTEEVLIKAGFEKSVWTDNGSPIWSGWECEHFLLNEELKLDAYAFMKPLKHLHQLQNLYFALTQTELEIDLTPTT